MNLCVSALDITTIVTSHEVVRLSRHLTRDCSTMLLDDVHDFISAPALEYSSDGELHIIERLLGQLRDPLLHRGANRLHKPVLELGINVQLILDVQKEILEILLTHHTYTTTVKKTVLGILGHIESILMNHDEHLVSSVKNVLVLIQGRHQVKGFVADYHVKAGGDIKLGHQIANVAVHCFSYSPLFSFL